MQNHGHDGEASDLASAVIEEIRTPPDEAWWPLRVAPWGAVLAVATMVVAYEPGASANQLVVGLLAASIAMVVGLSVYGLLIRLVPRRWYPRLRRGLAAVSTAVAFVGLTFFFGALLLGAAGGRPSWLPGSLELKEFIGLGMLLCFGWGVILLVVAIACFVGGRVADRDAAATG
jgi:hypothetical protein